MTVALLRFVAVGVANTALGYGVAVLSHHAVGFGPFVANAFGYVVGGVASYLLNRSFTFDSRRPHTQALPLFAATLAGCFLLNLLVLQIGLFEWHLPFPVAQGLSAVAYSAAFYVISRKVVFAR